MTEQEARQIIANDFIALYQDNTLPVPLRDLYQRISEKVLSGDDTSFTCLQKIEFLITGKSIPLLP